MRTNSNFAAWREPVKIASNSPPLVRVRTTPLIQLLCKFNGGCTPESLNREIRKKFNENMQFIQTLTSMTNEDVASAGIGQREFSQNTLEKKGLVTNHLRHIQFEVYPSKLTKMGADRIFALRGYLRVTVRQYYYVRYHIDLIYPNLPLLIVFGGRQHQYFYPLECLDFVEILEKDETI
ncbi:hypothetical protein ACQ4LE_001293 [Meloidogyne hapla]